MTVRLAKLGMDIDWMSAVGRLHPLLLHLPIGLLIALACVESLRKARRQIEPDAARSVLIGLLAVSTPLAAVTGWLLHESDDYGAPVELHEWLGIALMVVALIIAFAHRRHSRHFDAWLTLGVLLVIPTAHFGATLTHGAGYLTEPWTADRTEPAPVELERDHFSAAQPFFAAYCVQCHGETKRKGGLALHDMAALLAGSDEGSVIERMESSDSVLMARLRLPADDDDHMPPAGKRQPTPDEVDALAEWIASLSGTPDASLAHRLAGSPTVVGSVVESDPRVDEATIHDAIRALRGELVHVSAIAADTDALYVNFSAAHLAPLDLEQRLGALAERIADLDLSAQHVAAHDLEFLARLPQLEQLDLRQLEGPPIDLSPLASSDSLIRLNLAGTTVLETSITALESMPKLETVFVWKSGIGTEQLEALRAARPQLQIRGSSRPPDVALEIEAEVVFERLPESPIATAHSQPTNTVCPITGKTIDARFTILFEGRAIGFCCPNCPAQFWKDAASR